KYIYIYINKGKCDPSPRFEGRGSGADPGTKPSARSCCAVLDRQLDCRSICQYSGYLRSIVNNATQFTAEYAVAITSERLAKSHYVLTPQGGVEPATFRLKVRHATAELTRLACINIYYIVFLYL